MVMDMREINKIIVHCADTPEGRDVKTEEIKRWHTEERGWSDIGYHWVVELDGSVHAGRDESINGAHCRGHNSDSIGICYVGGADSEEILKTHEPKSRRILLSHLSQRYLEDIKRHRSTDTETFQKKPAHHTMQRQNTQGYKE